MTGVVGLLRADMGSLRLYILNPRSIPTFFKLLHSYTFQTLGARGPSNSVRAEDSLVYFQAPLLSPQGLFLRRHCIRASGEAAWTTG
jgi:hypothetical protein